MSDTHAQTAKVQADVQTGNTHVPPDRTEPGRQGARRSRSTAPYLLAAATALIVIVAALVLLN